MRNARVTFLTTADEKAALEARAASLGVSSGEYIRLAVDNFAGASAEQEAELTALLEQVSASIPRMQASLDRSSARLEELHEEMDAFFRDRGIS
jgi:hypothetical protein